MKIYVCEVWEEYEPPSDMFVTLNLSHAKKWCDDVLSNSTYIDGATIYIWENEKHIDCMSRSRKTSWD